MDHLRAGSDGEVSAESRVAGFRGLRGSRCENLKKCLKNLSSTFGTSNSGHEKKSRLTRRLSHRSSVSQISVVGGEGTHEGRPGVAATVASRKPNAAAAATGDRHANTWTKRSPSASAFAQCPHPDSTMETRARPRPVDRRRVSMTRTIRGKSSHGGVASSDERTPRHSHCRIILR
jgi:hypothetical protein